MSRIEILPEELANQIAAGEVIERPASVVKELVENSLDSGASRVDVQVEGSGTRLIRVIDNGCGMDEDDVLLSLERHATSKLASKEQLSTIATLGFRGEALPTIASVSRTSIISRTGESQLGTHAEIRYGELRSVHECGAVRGTLVEVKDLFGNVPARRKFLKTARTETSHIEEIIINTALSRADLALTYELNGRRVYSFPEQESLEARLKQVMATARGKDLIRLRTSTKEEGVVLEGYLLPPEQAGPGGRLRIFVNGRSVQDRMISHGVLEGMQGFLMKGRRPAGALFVNLPPEQVDVNVHPAKHEVRFYKPHIVHQKVVQAVRSALMEYQQGVKNTVFSSKDGSSSLQAAEENWTYSWQGEAVSDLNRSFKVELPARNPEKGKQMDMLRGFPSEGASGQGTDRNRAVNEDGAPPRGGDESFKKLTYIGQFRDSYLLCQSGDGLVIIDQHAAHERLLYESLKRQYYENKLTSQSLLFPEVIECDQDQVRILETCEEEIKSLGFEVESFGGRSYAVKAIPAALSTLGPLEAVAGLFSSYLEQIQPGSRGRPSRLEDILAGMACKAAVKARHHLMEIEGEELLKRMQEAPVFSHCPHGRPVLKQFSDEEIRKWFYRT